MTLICPLLCCLPNYSSLHLPLFLCPLNLACSALQVILSTGILHICPNPLSLSSMTSSTSTVVSIPNHYLILLFPIFCCLKITSIFHSQLIHSFIQAISIAPLQVHYSEALPTKHGYCVEFRPEAPQAIVNEGLSQGTYVAARAGYEPATLQKKGDESTNVPPCPTKLISSVIIPFSSCFRIVQYCGHH